MNNVSLVNIIDSGNSENLSLVNKIGDKREFTITRVHCIYSVPEARRLVQSTHKLCATTLGGKNEKNFHQEMRACYIQILTFILCILILGKGITELTKKNFSCTYIFKLTFV